MSARLRAACAGAGVLAAVASMSQNAAADTTPLPPDVGLAQFLPQQGDFPAGWTLGQAEPKDKAASYSKEGILASFGKHATPKDCYPDALVFFSAFGTASGGKPPAPATDSYVFATIARVEEDPHARGYTSILHYWVDNCAQYSVEAIPDWSSYPLAGSVAARTMPVVRADDSIAVRVKEKTSRGPNVEMTAIAARLRGVEVLVTGYPGADESLVDSLFRETVERVDEWEP